MHVLYLPSAFSDTIRSISFTKWVKSRGRHIYVSDLRHSQILAVNHKATCCVSWLDFGSLRTEGVYFAPAATPKESVFHAQGEYQPELWACRTQMALCRTLSVSQAQKQCLNTCIVSNDLWSLFHSLSFSVFFFKSCVDWFHLTR